MVSLSVKEVKRFKEFSEGTFDRRGDERGFEDSLIRGFESAEDSLEIGDLIFGGYAQCVVQKSEIMVWKTYPQTLTPKAKTERGLLGVFGEVEIENFGFAKNVTCYVDMNLMMIQYIPLLGRDIFE